MVGGEEGFLSFLLWLMNDGRTETLRPGVWRSVAICSYSVNEHCFQYCEYKY